MSSHMAIEKRHWNAPAKVNLTLKVTGKRADGFHNLESVMAPIDLADSLVFEEADEYSLVCDSPGVPVDETNLVTKAVRIFQQQSGKPCAWKLTLVKNVPHGAGLGGGSSDAATALLALNDLEDARIRLDDLAEMAAIIGSDIPFFIYQQPCLIEGRGDVVRPMETLTASGVEMLLLKPSFGVSTPDAYRGWAGAVGLPGIDYEPQKTSWGWIGNDLEKPVFQKHRFLAEMKVWLLAQPEVSAAMMSGSGSTMMAFFEDCEGDFDAQADVLFERAKKELDPTLWGRKVTIS